MFTSCKLDKQKLILKTQLDICTNNETWTNNGHSDNMMIYREGDIQKLNRNYNRVHDLGIVVTAVHCDNDLGLGDVQATLRYYELYVPTMLLRIPA